MSPIENNTILNVLKNSIYNDEAIELYNILLSVPQNVTSIDLSYFTDKIVKNAEWQYKFNYDINSDFQEADIGASEYISYTIHNMLLVRVLFPNITNIKASNKFNSYVNNKWWSKNNEEIYKIFDKNI